MTWIEKMKCKPVLLSFLSVLFLAQNSSAGFMLGDEDNSVEIRGRVRTYYKYRFDEPEGERDVNRFAVDQARMGLKGTFLGDFEFEVDIELGEGSVKFRCRDSWSQNWGGSSFPEGEAVWFGPNIPVEPGRYHITLDLTNYRYSFERLTD